jgi:hypothetical protein
MNKRDQLNGEPDLIGEIGKLKIGLECLKSQCSSLSPGRRRTIDQVDSQLSLRRLAELLKLSQERVSC